MGGGQQGRRRRSPDAEPTKDPKKRLAMLSKKLNSILEVSLDEVAALLHE
jgi:hypothetical protein